MAKQDTTADLKTPFDAKAFEDAARTFARTAERGTGIFVEAGQRSTDLAVETSHEALSNLREATQVRDEPADYGKAFADLAQRQMDLFVRSTQAYAEIAQSASETLSSLMADSGKSLTDTAGRKTA